MLIKRKMVNSYLVVKKKRERKPNKDSGPRRKLEKSKQNGRGEEIKQKIRSKENMNRDIQEDGTKKKGKMKARKKKEQVEKRKLERGAKRETEEKKGWGR